MQRDVLNVIGLIWYEDLMIDNLNKHSGSRGLWWNIWLQYSFLATHLWLLWGTQYKSLGQVPCWSKVDFYGVSFSAVDYCRCLLKRLCGIAECNDISGQYLRSPTKNDATNIDVFYNSHSQEDWGNWWVSRWFGADKGTLSCRPSGWKEQLENEEEYPTIGLVTVAGYNLWYGTLYLDCWYTKWYRHLRWLSSLWIKGW